MDHNGASKRLLKGTIIYMIGNMSSKVLQMLILPLVTGILLTDEYGYYDLIITTINLVTPIITLQIVAGLFRFSFDLEKENLKTLVSTTTIYLAFAILILGIIISLGNAIYPSLKYPWLIYLNYIMAIFFDYTQKISRTQQRNKEFAISGVLHTFSMLAIQVITLVILKMRVDGMLIASCASYFIAGIYLQLKIRIDRYLAVKFFSKEKFYELLAYSAPLVPNSIAWWLLASSDRYIISFFIDTSANGIYSIAGKFSQLLTFATGVFQMAWQESAILEANSEERDLFYTKTFNSYMVLLFSSYLVILPFVRIVFPLLIDLKFQNAYVYNPILLFGAVLSALSQFYGTSYIVFKKTNGAFFTSLIAAVINIVIGLGTVKYIGLYGPAIGTVVAFLAQWFIRAYQMRPYFKVKINYKHLSVLTILCIITACLYYTQEQIIHILQFVCGLGIFYFYNRQHFLLLISKIKRRGSRNEI